MRCLEMISKTTHDGGAGTLDKKIGRESVGKLWDRDSSVRCPISATLVRL